jgi:hypothetical protein
MMRMVEGMRAAAHRLHVPYRHWFWAVRDDGDRHIVCRLSMVLTQNSRIYCAIPYLGI